MEVAVSFRASFDDNKNVTANHLYKMDEVLREWLRNVTDNANTRELHKNLEKAAGVLVPNFYLWVTSDIYSVRDQEDLEERAKAEAEAEATESVGT